METRYEFVDTTVWVQDPWRPVQIDPTLKHIACGCCKRNIPAGKTALHNMTTGANWCVSCSTRQRFIAVEDKEVAS